MPFDLKNSLVIGVASSALLDTSEAEAVFKSRGLAAYRIHQEERLGDCFAPGVIFPFVKRLLSLNDLSDGPQGSPLVEVILVSRNDIETGLRATNSIQALGLPITRKIFTGGGSPRPFLSELNVSLFLSANEQDVHDAMAAGLPAGLILPSSFVDDDGDDEVRLAFDFDGVLADDSAELIFQERKLKGFHEHETARALEPLPAGPLYKFLLHLSGIRSLEERKLLHDPAYKRRLRMSLVTARNAPADLRAITTLKRWGIRIDEGCFLGGIDKGGVVRALRPHVFFDDQRSHLERTVPHTPSVHVPFGSLNRAPSASGTESELTAALPAAA